MIIVLPDRSTQYEADVRMTHVEGGMTDPQQGVVRAEFVGVGAMHMRNVI
jgi:hypothetical protein